MTSPHSVQVVHRPDASCFEAAVEGQRALAQYELDGKVVHMVHTEVPPALEGRGIAAALVEAAFEWAQSQGYKINARCAYVRAYLTRHPQWQQLQV